MSHSSTAYLCEDDFAKLDVTKVPSLALVESIEAGHFKEMGRVQSDLVMDPRHPRYQAIYWAHKLGLIDDAYLKPTSFKRNTNIPNLSAICSHCGQLLYIIRGELYNNCLLCK